MLLHCVATHSRTPAVAIAYAMQRGVGLEEATRRVLAALPEADPNRGFRASLGRLSAGAGLDTPPSSLGRLLDQQREGGCSEGGEEEGRDESRDSEASRPVHPPIVEATRAGRATTSTPQAWVSGRP